MAIAKVAEGTPAAAARTGLGSTTNHQFPGSGSGTLPTFNGANTQLLMIGWTSSSRSVSTVTDLVGNTWTQLSQANASTARCAIFYCSNFVGQPADVYINFNGANNSDTFVHPFEYSGVDEGSFQTLDQVLSDGDGVQVIGPLTPNASGAMAIECASQANNRGVTRDNNYNLTRPDRRLYTQDRIITKPDTSAESITVTIGGSGALIRTMLMFDAAVSGGPQPPVQNSDIPDIDANEADTGSYDVAANGHFSLGTDGVGPLEYLKDETNGPPWPVDIDINTAGLISWTNAVAPGEVDLQVIARDVGAALDTSSNPFNYNVVGPAAPESIGTYPNIAIATGASYSDATAYFQVDPVGGTGPLSFSESPAGTAWPADISVNASTGEISVASGVEASTLGLRVRCTDDGNGLFTDGNAFDYVVTTQSGTITTTPAKDAEGNLITGVTGCVCYVLDAATGAELLRATGVDQQPDGTFTLTDSNITPTQATMGAFFKPDPDPANRRHGSFDLDAT